jgi:hypothetical protein
LWVKTDIAVWTVVVGGSAWVTAHGGRAISFGVILFVWASYRLAGSAALSRLDVAKAASESRLETVGGWLYISRRAFSGALFVALGVDAVVTHPSRGGIVFGVIGCGFGLPFVVLGLTFIRRWMQRRANPPVSGTRSVG